MSDPRFARLKTDPRFRKPKQKALKVEIDDRFKDVLESEEFGGKGKGKGKAGQARVDKRGRPIASSHHQDQLKRFYRLRSPEADADANAGRGKDFVDYARGEGALSSSGSEDESSEAEEEELEVGGKRRLPVHTFDDEEGSESDAESDSGSDEDHLQVDLSENDEPVSAFPPDADEEEGESEEEPSVPPTKRIAAVNLDWDNLRATDLYAVFNSFLKADPKFVGGSEGRGRLVDVKIYPSEFGKERMAKEEEEGPGGGIFISKGVKKEAKRKEGLVRQEDLDSDESEEEQEEDDDEDEGEEEEEEDEAHASDSGDVEGDEEFSDEDEEDDRDDDEDEEDAQPRASNSRPRKEIDGLEIISDVESDAGSEDIDMDQLRQYQLERLRYFYAIATFSSVAAAEYVMDELNGTEFERTANVMDLSYVPEGMEFADDEIRDEANKEPKAYKGNDFVTDALRHSKVKLTWDQDDPNRIKMTRRTLTREEIEEEDFKNLVASSGSENDDEEDHTPAEAEGGKKGKKAKKQSMKERTAKLRSLLLAGDDEEGDVWGKAGTAWADELEDIKAGKDSKAKKGKKAVEGEMEITFRPGLSVSKANDGEDDDENLTTLERYQMRMKEKRARKKEKMELKKGLKGVDSDGNASTDEGEVGGGIGGGVGGKDDFFGSDEEEEDEDDDELRVVISTKPQAKDKGKGQERSKSDKADKAKSISKSNATSQEDPDLAALTALVGARPEGGDTNFSMKDILRAEKESGKKRRRRRNGKKGADGDEAELGPEGWKINVKDERFKALHQEPEFAIDPSNPHFTKTQAMRDLLAERTRIRNTNLKSNEAPREKGLKRDANTSTNGSATASGEKNLNDLVESVKRKMDQSKGKRKRSRK